MTVPTLDQHQAGDISDLLKTFYEKFFPLFEGSERVHFEDVIFILEEFAGGER